MDGNWSLRFDVTAPSETLDTLTKEASIIHLETQIIKHAIDSSLDSGDRWNSAVEQSSTLFSLLCGMNIECEDTIAGEGTVRSASWLMASGCNVAFPTNWKVSGLSLLFLWQQLTSIWVLQPAGLTSESGGRNANVHELKIGSLLPLWHGHFAKSAHLTKTSPE